MIHQDNVIGGTAVILVFVTCKIFQNHVILHFPDFSPTTNNLYQKIDLAMAILSNGNVEVVYIFFAIVFFLRFSP